ncbi:MAG: hypothetical protein GWP19_03100 [Planctomycetia bacterium]|nr:hypothetical protein [Planctomycetia bacterium]
MTTIIIGIFVFAISAMRITRYFGFEKWQVSLGLILVAIFLYIINVISIHHFIEKKTPDFASTKEASPNIQKWELTAGRGVVPKWVSIIGLLSISAFITAIGPWIVAFIK